MKIGGRKDIPWLILSAYFLMLPWEYLLELPVPSSQIFGVLFGLVLGVFLLNSRHSHVYLTPFHQRLTAWVAWCAVTVLWSASGDDSTHAIFALVKCYIPAIASWHISRNRADWLRLVQLYLLSFSCSTLYALADYYKLVGRSENLYFEEHWRFSGTHYEPNVFAVAVAAALPLAGLASVASRSRNMRILYGAFIPIGWYGILLSASRTGLICASFASALMLSMRFPGRRNIILFGGLITILAFAAGYVHIPDIISERLGGTAEDVQSGELSGRLEVWNVGLEIFSNNLVGGVGWGAFTLSTYDYFYRTVAAHDTLISCAAETGLIGLGLFFFTFGALAARAVSQRIPLGPAPIISLATLAIGSLTLTFTSQQPIWALIILNTGLVFSENGLSSASPATEP